MRYPTRLVIKWSLLGFFAVTYIMLWIYSYRTDAFRQKITNNLQNRSLADRTYGAILSAENGQLLFVISGNENHYIQYVTATKQVRAYVRTLNEYLADNPRQAKTFKALSRVIDLKLTDLQLSVDLYRKGNPAEALKISRASDIKDYTQQITDLIATLRAQETNDARSVNR